MLKNVWSAQRPSSELNASAQRMVKFGDALAAIVGGLMSRRAMGKQVERLSELPAELTQARRFGKNLFGPIDSFA